jgi:hypothetical protein
MNRLSIVAPLLLAACVEDGGAGLLLPDQVQVGWQPEYNGRGDGLGALVPVDVMAYDPASGEPTPDVTLHVWTDDGAAMPVPTDGVTVLDEDLHPVVGPVLDDAAEGPTAFEAWDAEHDQFVAVAPADELDLRTDGSGVARMYLFVDAFPETAAGFSPVRVVVARGGARTGTDGLFWLAPR